ncbi:MAG: hypothetical protein ABI645_13940 [Pseudomonadota bacterium]
MPSTRPVFPCLANHAAAKMSDAVPTSASTTTPRNTEDIPEPLAVSDNAPATCSATATSAVANTRTPTLLLQDGPGARDYIVDSEAEYRSSARDCHWLFSSTEDTLHAIIRGTAFILPTRQRALTQQGFTRSTRRLINHERP